MSDDVLQKHVFYCCVKTLSVIQCQLKANTCYGSYAAKAGSLYVEFFLKVIVYKCKRGPVIHALELPVRPATLYPRSPVPMYEYKTWPKNLFKKRKNVSTAV